MNMDKPCRLTSILLLTVLLFLSACRHNAPIALVAPEFGSVVTHMREDWRQILAENRDKEAKNYPGDFYKDVKGQPVPIVFTWETPLPPPYTLEISTDHEFKRIDRVITTESKRVEVYNLEIDREYRWRVHAGGICSGTCSFNTQGPFRQIFVSATGPVNVRDWGGKEIPNVGRTRQGLLYRGTQLQTPFALNEQARTVMLKELGIKTDLDLRYDSQVEGMTGSPLGPSVTWFHYAINAYNSFKPENREAQFPLWRDTMRVFADKNNYPIYFHCYGGVDRTGEVALLLNFLLGVNEELAFLDYDLSTMANFYRHHSIAYLQQWLKNLQAYAPEGTRREQVEKYLLAIGLSQQEIEAIRDNLTEK